MSKRKPVSSRKCIKILCTQFGFFVKRKTGGHVVLRKETDTGAVVTVFPDRKELKAGTLKSVLKLARVTEESFYRYA